MLQTANTALLWVGAIGCAVIGGVYFAFSTFIMAAFATLDRAAAMSAMSAINDVILKSLFMPLFFGTTIVSLAIAVVAILRWDAPGSLVALIAGVVLVVGMFVITAVFNVPLNNELVATAPDSSQAADVWARYLKDWVFWNHVRTVASTVPAVLYIWVLVKG